MRNDVRRFGPLVGFALLVVGGYALRALVRSAVVGEMSRTGTLPWLLPEFGTTGETVTVYLLGVSLVSYVAIPAVAFALGYRFRRTADRAGPQSQ
jgi:hypothetical protein